MVNALVMTSFLIRGRTACAIGARFATFGQQSRPVPRLALLVQKPRGLIGIPGALRRRKVVAGGKECDAVEGLDDGTCLDVPTGGRGNNMLSTRIRASSTFFSP